MPNKKKYIEISLSSFFLCYSVLIYTPILILYLNGEQNPFFISDLIIPAAACLSAIVISICITKLSDRASTIAHILCGAVCLYVLVSVNVYPFQSGPWDGMERPALSCQFSDNSANVYIDYTTNVYEDSYVDSDPSSYAEIDAMTSSDATLVGFAEPQMGLTFRFVPGHYNTTAATAVTVSYWNGAAWTSVGTVTDGTSSGGISFSQAGAMTWNPVAAGSEFVTEVAGGAPLYYYHVAFSVNLSADVQLRYISGTEAPKTINAFNKMSLLGHILLAMACFGIFLKYRETAKRVLNIIGIFSVVFACYIIIMFPFVRNNYPKMLEVGRNNNVIIIVMDMFQGYFISNFVEKNPEISTKFDGFLYFNNAVSVAPYSTVSTRYILTGESPQQETGSTLVIDQNDNLLSDAIKNGYDTTYVSISVPVNLPNLHVFSANNNFVKTRSYIQFAYTCSKRYYPSRSLPDNSSAPLLEFGWMSKIDARDSWQWFSENLFYKANIGKTFHYYHNIMTHKPIRFNLSGEYRLKRSPDDLYGEIEFAFTTLAIFIDRLKKIGKYDDTTIIIIGDHGYHRLNEFSDKVLPLKAHYLLDPVAKKQKGQYDVAIMIKPRHSSGAMYRTDAAVVLSDLRKTINEIMVPESGNNFKGVNILQQNLPTERTVTILSYTGEKWTLEDFNRFDYWKPLELILPISGHR